MVNKNSRAKNLIVLGAILMLVSFLFQGQTISVISATSPLTFDFNTGTSPWQLERVGAGSMATLTGVNSYARLTCTSYDPAGYVIAVYLFDSDALTVDSSYTVTFSYLSDIDFSMNYFAQDSMGNNIDRKYIICPASSSWTQKTLSVANIQAAAYYQLVVAVNTVGTVNFDSVQVTLAGGTQPTANPTTTPTPTPLPTATPAPTPLITPSPTDPPQPTDAKVTLSGYGGGLIMRYNGLTLPCSPLASSVYYVPQGTTVTLTSNPAQGTSFTKWEINGETYTSDPLQVLVNGDLEVKGFFEAAPTTNPTTHPTANPTTNPNDNTISSYSGVLLYIGAGLAGLGLIDFMLKRKTN